MSSIPDPTPEDLSLDLEAAYKRTQDATDGTWAYDGWTYVMDERGPVLEVRGAAWMTPVQQDANGHMVAAAKTDLPAAIRLAHYWRQIAENRAAELETTVEGWRLLAGALAAENTFAKTAADYWRAKALAVPGRTEDELRLLRAVADEAARVAHINAVQPEIAKIDRADAASRAAASQIVISNKVED